MSAASNNIENNPEDSVEQPKTRGLGPSKRCSAHRVEANRANAKRSTGPITPEGKERASANAIDHGWYCVKHLHVDDQERFHKALAHWWRIFKPANDYETTLVREMAMAAARLERMYAGDRDRRELAAQEARRGFVRRRRKEVCDHADALFRASSPTRLLLDLEHTIFGIEWLVDRWRDLRGALPALNDDNVRDDSSNRWTRNAVERLLALQGVPANPSPADFGIEPQLADTVMFAASLLPDAHLVALPRSLLIQGLRLGFHDKLARLSDFDDDKTRFADHLRSLLPSPEVALPALIEVADAEIERLEALRDTAWADFDVEEIETVMRAAMCDAGPEANEHFRRERVQRSAMHRSLDRLEKNRTRGFPSAPPPFYEEPYPVYHADGTIDHVETDARTVARYIAEAQAKAEADRSAETVTETPSATPTATDPTRPINPGRAPAWIIAEREARTYVNSDPNRPERNEAIDDNRHRAWGETRQPSQPSRPSPSSAPRPGRDDLDAPPRR